MRSKARILVVEDEQDIRDLMALHLLREGFEVEEASDGEGALRKLNTSRFDLFAFDWMLPGMSGLELTRALRKKGDDSPILMVTAKVEPADIVLGLESGADDYITKPFEVPVFLARVRALLRRANDASVEPPSAQSARELRLGDLKIDLDAHDVHCAGENVSLTPSEFKLLTALIQNQGKVLTRSRLIDLVQGEGVAVVDRTVDTHVFGLRKKLGPCGDLIETVRGVGYRVKGSQSA